MYIELIDVRRFGNLYAASQIFSQNTYDALCVCSFSKVVQEHLFVFAFVWQYVVHFLNKPNNNTTTTTTNNDNNDKQCHLLTFLDP